MYKVEVISDRIEQEAINRRKKLDADRKERIFNPKVRILGVDLKALDQQIDIKNHISDVERKRNEALDHQAKLNNEILQLMDEKVKQARRNQLKDMNDFRKQNQQPYQRRDFDLYDPAALKNDFPARVTDEDPRIGVSSLQRFEGEDLAVWKREDHQKEQMRIWTDEQLFEKEQLRQRALNEKKQYESFQRNINDKMDALQRAVEKAKKDQAKYDNEYNQALTEEKYRREEKQKAYETELNTREIINNVNGVYLTEQPDVFNIGGGHKVRVDLFKGFTPEQKRNILEIQEKQRIEHQQALQKKEREENEWAIQDMANRRAIELMTREKERRAKQLSIQIRKENELKALEDKKRRNFIDKVLYTNPPQDAYFNQFNTTSR
ncbi:RIB43A-domain-containing protein [Globomyces pollinis-pini]|nr:RIB43A-domain-containing protein [Globomyces pollinis-pini]